MLTVPSVAAHAYLVDATPGPNERLVEAPSELRLEFSERLEPRYTTANVTDAVGAPKADGQPVFPADERHVLIIPLHPLDPGTYLVHWSTLSLDGHTARGAYHFVVANETVAVAPVAESYAGHFHVVSRAVYYVGLLCAVGIPLLARRILPRGSTDHDNSRPLLMAYAGALALIGAAAGGFAALGSAAAVGTDDAVGFFVLTQPGRFLAGQVLFLGAAAALFMWRGRTTAVAWTGVAAAAAALLCTTGASHAAASIHFRGIAVTADIVHMAAASVWVGGVMGLGLWLPGRLRVEAGAAIRAFSPWAIGAVVALAAAGLVSAVLRVGSLAALVTTVYGVAVLVKAAILVGLASLGAYNRYRVAARLEGQAAVVEGSVPTIWWEIALMVVALLATGLLVSLAAPR